MEGNNPKPSTITMILYIIDNDKKNPSQSWEIIPKKKYTIGRSKKEVDLPLGLKLLSRKHAELIYYDSKTILIKDLNSRNGTFINKLKIEPLKDTFFTNKEILSFGNINNEIVFFDNNEQPKEEKEQTNSEKEKYSEKEKEENSDKIDIIKENKNINKYETFEEVNTDIKQDIKEEREKSSKNNQKREIESTSGRRLLEEKYKNNSKGQSRQRDLNREISKDNSISNRANYEGRIISSHINNSNLDSPFRERNDIINYADKSHSREYRNISRSRSGSIETLIQQYNRNQRDNEPEIKNEMSFKINNEKYSPRNEVEIERQRERERYRDKYTERERSRRESNERSYRAKIERDIQEDKYMMRKRNEEMRRREENERKEYIKRREREREREKERERGIESQRTYYERRREYNDINNYNKYFEEGNKIILKPEKFDIVMNQNFENIKNKNDDKEGDMGYIKCYVEGYMYLKIKKDKNSGFK